MIEGKLVTTKRDGRTAKIKIVTKLIKTFFSDIAS